MSPLLPGTLCALALLDATSIGTLLIPVWLLSDPHWRPRLFATYVATLAAFYTVVGVGLAVLLDAGTLLRGQWARGDAWSWAGAALSLALLGWGLLLERQGTTAASAHRVSR